LIGAGAPSGKANPVLPDGILECNAFPSVSIRADPIVSQLLDLNDITVKFGGLCAVDQVSIKVRPGERRAILGPNGAGKTTLFNVITGVIHPSSGKVVFAGKDITREPIHARARKGICRTFQITNLFSSLCVEENMMLAVYGGSSKKFSMLGKTTLNARAQEKIDQALRFTDLLDRRRVVVHALSYGEQRQLELAMTLVAEPRLLLLDEPAAGLSPSERVMLSDIIRALPRDLPIVLIDHDMDLVLKLVDYISVLSNGKLLAEGGPQDIKKNTEVQNVYFGKARDDA